MFLGSGQRLDCGLCHVVLVLYILLLYILLLYILALCSFGVPQSWSYSVITPRY